MKMLSYRVLFRKEPEGGFTVTVPSLPLTPQKVIKILERRGFVLDRAQ